MKELTSSENCTDLIMKDANIAKFVLGYLETDIAHSLSSELIVKTVTLNFRVLGNIAYHENDSYCLELVSEGLLKTIVLYLRNSLLPVLGKKDLIWMLSNIS